jgi:myo-inositol-1(or 4)-monophosphatase
MTDMLEFALETARGAGRILCEYSDQHHVVSRKTSEIDLVTEADVASERLIVAAIQMRFPDHMILAEEGLGNIAGTELQTRFRDIDHLWLVDPLDGTVNYAHDYPIWGVSMAFAERGVVILALTYAPRRKEAFWAERGGGAWLDGKRLRVSAVSRTQDALVATGFPYRRATLAQNNLAEFGAVMPRVQGVRRAGAAILDLADLAAGRLDAYWERHLKPWDWAAGWLLVQEAGGTVTGMHGEPWFLGMEHLVASNGQIHDELLALLGADQTRPRLSPARD